MIRVIKRINFKKVRVFVILFICIVFSHANFVFAKNTESNNANLKILRLNHVGITPKFEKDIKEYYFIADMSINQLGITAIPENENATVKIAGNTELKEGLNIIDIEVESEDKMKTEIYKIYVTKTESKEQANSNLENLAVKQGILEPPFQSDITHYYVGIGNDISKIDILAIAQNMNAQVDIEGNNELKIGENKITVKVVAENGITNKNYIITVYRRSEKEEIEEEAEREEQQEQLAILLENSELYSSKRLSSEVEGTVANKIIKTEDIVTFILLGIILLGFIIMFIVEKFKRK